jgi:uncharacterized protein
VTVDRTWKDGDVVQIRMPMTLHVETLPDDPHIQALVYGPVVLVGDLGTGGLENVKRIGPSAPPLGRIPSMEVPSFVAPSQADLLSHVKPVAGKTLTFRTDGLGQPSDVTLAPLYRTFEPRYTVYWTVYTPPEWDKHKADIAVVAAHRKEIEGRTFDTVNVGDDASEKAHAFSSESADQGFVEGRRWRDARGSGYLSYEVNVQPDKPLTLVCTFRGSEGQRRVFDILVDGQKIATETLAYHPTELLDREYLVPEALTRGKTKVTVRFQPQPNARTGGLVEIRAVQPGR